LRGSVLSQEEMQTTRQAAMAEWRVMNVDDKHYWTSRAVVDASELPAEEIPPLRAYNHDRLWGIADPSSPLSESVAERTIKADIGLEQVSHNSI
jgi:hypothetical protein